MKKYIKLNLNYNFTKMKRNNLKNKALLKAFKLKVKDALKTMLDINYENKDILEYSHIP